MHRYIGRLNSSTFFIYFVCSAVCCLRFVALDILISNYMPRRWVFFRFLWWCQSTVIIITTYPCKWFHGVQLFPVCGQTIVPSLQMNTASHAVVRWEVVRRKEIRLRKVDSVGRQVNILGLFLSHGAKSNTKIPWLTTRCFEAFQALKI